MELGLKASRALVAGGNSGIGRAVAQALVREGARVAILARDQQRTTEAVDEVGAELAVLADTRDDEAVRRAMAETADVLGGLDILVNCAAARALPGQAPGLDGVVDAEFLSQLDTKALGYLRLIRAAAPHLREGGGAVVNVAGMNARLTGSIVGTTRNLAVVALSKSLADELGPSGVSVTCVHPGLTLTERNCNDPATLAAARLNALGRPVTAAEVADVIAFLASPRGRIANGAIIELDGGFPGVIWT